MDLEESLRSYLPLAIENVDGEIKDMFHGPQTVLFLGSRQGFEQFGYAFSLRLSMRSLQFLYIIIAEKIRRLLPGG